MKRFRFTLQALLTLRQREEHEALERYAAALLARRRAAEVLASVEDELARAATVLNKHLVEGALAADLARIQNHYRTVESRYQEALDALKAAEQKIRPAHEGMLESRRQREVVEGCQEKQRERHSRDAMRIEAKLQDELAGRRFAPALVARGND
jgi:flagellar export protein FliJ